MKEALRLAVEAGKRGDRPVGAVIVHKKKIIARGSSRLNTLNSRVHHAENTAIFSCASYLKEHGPECTLYTTLEPCIMCLGAMIHARIKRLIYGCPDPKGGAAVSLYQLGNDNRLNHQIEVRGGVLAEECGALLSRFFQTLRSSK